MNTDWGRRCIQCIGRVWSFRGNGRRETLAAAKAQIEEKQYAAALEARGIPKERIRSYGFAFEGKRILIG